MAINIQAQAHFDKVRRFVKAPVEPNVMDRILQIWRETIGIPTDALEAAKAKRDHGLYHITVVQPAETRKILKASGRESLQPITSESMAFEVIGFAQASSDESTAYFAVVRSAQADRARSSMDLPKQDFHITLGFTVKDVHGVDKSAANPSFRSIS